MIKVEDSDDVAMLLGKLLSLVEPLRDRLSQQDRDAVQAIASQAADWEDMRTVDGKQAVRLCNGEQLLIEEGDGSISLSLGDRKFVGVSDGYICSIDQDGVRVYPNSGDAPRALTEGLVARRG